MCVLRPGRRFRREASEGPVDALARSGASAGPSPRWNRAPSRSEAVCEPDVDEVHRVRDGAQVDRPLRPVASVAVDALLAAGDGVTVVAGRTSEPADAARAAILALELLDENVPVPDHDLERARLLPGAEANAI